MRTLFASIVFALFVTSLAAHAQSVPDTPLPTTVEGTPESQVVSAITGKLDSEQMPSEGNAPILIDLPLPFAQGIGSALRGLSTGQGNVAVVNQRGNRNEARVEQIGQSNVAVMIQRGDYNASSVLQDGSNNAYSSFLRGNYNETSVLQRGDNNTYSLGFIGNNLDHSVLQDGSGHTAAQFGVGFQPFSIRQVGNGMDITIRHNGAQ